MAGRSVGSASAAVELQPFALEPLQREVQAAAPLAERGIRLCEEPGDAGHLREVDIAARAAPRAAQLGERPVAARAGEQVAEILGCGHRVSLGRSVLERIVAALLEAKPVHRSRYVKADRRKKNNGYPAILGRVTVVENTQKEPSELESLC